MSTAAERAGVKAKEFQTWELIEALDERGKLGDAAREFRVRTRRAPWKRLRLSESIWGFSLRWFCVCPWNGESFWVTLPFVYFEVGKLHAELGLGKGKWYLAFDVRWRWE